jgi:hypothetical protein
MKKICSENQALNDPNHELCYVPRDFFGYYQNPKKILVIGINPGKILKRETREYGKIHLCNGPVTISESEKMVEKHLELAEEMFQKGMHIQENKLRISFHKDFPEAVSKILRVDIVDIFKYVNYTTMVKCQTARSYTKLRLSEKELLASQCYKTHLKREIAYFNPELILTYGEEVYDHLPLRELIPIKIFKLPRIWGEASADQRKHWRNMLDVVSNNLAPIMQKIKADMNNL